MKKLIVVLTACMALTCIFSSCGDEKKEDSSVSESSSDSVQNETETLSETEEPTAEDEEKENTLHEYLDDADPTAFLGKWECDKILVDGEEISDIMGMPLYSLYQYDIIEGGTVGLSDSLIAITTEEDNIDYKWGLISENEIEIVGDNGSVIQFTLDGDYLVNISSESNTEIYLKKVDEFTPFDYQAFIDDYDSQQNEVVLTPVETVPSE
ncbi:MAG: hypothetical protein K2I06_05400 [Ruminococcus sp.]|nr:hypothetical protein [Ruminococcus sp.]